MAGQHPVARSAILVVDDDEAIRRLISYILASKGYNVLEASGGLHAVQVARQHEGPIGLLVTDVCMPELDGPGLVVKLREARPHLHVIYTSAQSKRYLGYELGDEQFLSKPFTPEDLIDAVGTAMSVVQWRLKQAWNEAFDEYKRQVGKTLELLESNNPLPAQGADLIEGQRAAERHALEKYKTAKRAYLEFIRGAGVLALLIALHAR